MTDLTNISLQAQLEKCDMTTLSNCNGRTCQVSTILVSRETDPEKSKSSSKLSCHGIYLRVNIAVGDLSSFLDVSSSAHCHTEPFLTIVFLDVIKLGEVENYEIRYQGDFETIMGTSALSKV